MIGGEWIDGDTVTISKEGLYFVFFRAINNAGTPSITSQPNSIAIDKTAPTISITNTSGKFIITVNDIALHYFNYEIYLDNVLKSSGTSTESNTIYSYSEKGIWKVYVRAFDWVGYTQNQNPRQDDWYYQTFTVK